MTTDAERLSAWADTYDTEGELAAVYDELVVQRVQNPDRFTIMGAWKTGCLSTEEGKYAYRDKSGKTYYYTADWNPKSPVGYQVWNTIASQDAAIAGLVPKHFADFPPKLAVQLTRLPGFDFEKAVFVLHCVQYSVFPAYDQHLYRAFKYLISGNYTTVDASPPDWSDYGTYRRFFEETVRTTGLSPVTVTRGLLMLGRAAAEGEL